MSEETTSLTHYGVKGMKWGVRRSPAQLGHRTSSKKSRSGPRYGASKKDTKSTSKNNRDHSKSDKSELISFVENVALDVVYLNPVGAVIDTGRLIQAGESAIKSKFYEKERKQCQRDKKTGFLLKNQERTQKEDAARVNPSVHNFDANTKNNCMLCTATYDLRRRGYEVQAKKASYGYLTKDVKAWYPKAKIRKISGENAKGKPSTKEMIPKLKNALLKQGEGARGNLMVTWKNMAGGHSVAYEVTDGNLRIIDAQVNKIYSNPDSFLKRCSPTVEYARLDNVGFSNKNIKEVAR